MSTSDSETGRDGRPGRRWLALSGPLLGLVVVLTLFVVLIGLKGGPRELGKFASLRNLQVLVQEGTVRGVVALGMLLIIISGGIDLSVGSVAALVTVVTMYVYGLQFQAMHSAAQATLFAVPAGVAVGGLCGMVNGLVITRLRVTPFVATLGMYGVARGLAYWVSERQQLGFPRNGRPHWVDVLSEVHASGTVFNPAFWSLVALAAAVAAVLRFTVLGRYCYAIGSNEAAARLCGVAIEHAISPRLEQAIAVHLGEPLEDPHGHPIPSREGEITRRKLQPLALFRPGESVIIREAQDDNPDRLRRWRELGLIPGTVLRILSHQPLDNLYQLQVGERTVTLAPEGLAGLSGESVSDSGR